MNILFVGNSYTFFSKMPTLFEWLAKDNGKDVTVYSVTAGGRRLEQYQTEDDPATIELKTLLANHSFDVCFLQEQSLLPVTDKGEFFKGITIVTDLIGQNIPRKFLYETWGRKEGSTELADLGLTNQSMTKALALAYREAAETFGFTVSHVGENFYTVHHDHPDLELYCEDFSHPSHVGSCLAALTHYYSLFGELPQKIDALTLSQEDFALLSAAIVTPKETLACGE
ncbi:MAG: hypothetical protein IKT68_01395 [Clostridia bacterium]|nr:hypothetical protein [Clostridia bacterium]